MLASRSAILFVALSISVIVGHFLPLLNASELENGIRNSLHIVAFGVFSALVFDAAKQFGRAKAAVIAVLVAASVGAISELLQSVLGNRSDLSDLQRDVAGACLAVSSVSLWSAHSQANARKAYLITRRVTAIALVLVLLSPLIYWSTVYVKSRTTFPTLLTFDNWWERHLYYPINSSLSVESTSPEINHTLGLTIGLSSSGRSGIGFYSAEPDWSNFDVLAFTASVRDGPNGNVTVRMNDSQRLNHFSDSFMVKISVPNNPTEFRIPLVDLATDSDQHSMNLTDIREVVIFARDKRRHSSLVLENIRLE